jgi:hypothetical protein
MFHAPKWGRLTAEASTPDARRSAWVAKGVEHERTTKQRGIVAASVISSGLGLWLAIGLLLASRARRSRFLTLRRGNKLMRDSRLAEDVVRPVVCPFCNGRIIDTLAKVLTETTSWRCRECDRTWTIASLRGSSNALVVA